jgi:uncharacterized membrane protein
MIGIGLFFVLVGSVGSIISLINPKARGFNLTRLKFVTYNWAWVIIGAIFIIVGLIAEEYV